MTDVVERLREEADWLSGGELNNMRLSVGSAVNVMNDAADEIEKLRVENERLRGALRIELSAITDADVVWAIDALAEQPDEPDLIDQIICDVSELPDRNSPEDWPDAMLVTADELRIILERALEQRAPPPPGEQSHDEGEPEWTAIKCHFCGEVGKPMPWRKGSLFACEECGEREING
jgi:hypothetical protein